MQCITRMICLLFHFNLNHRCYRKKESNRWKRRVLKTYCNICLCLKIDLIEQAGELKKSELCVRMKKL